MAKRALVVMAEGYEDVEAVAVIDVLNRVGVDVTVASLDYGPVKAAYGITLVPDTSLDRLEDDLYDAVFFPGGAANAQRLAGEARVQDIAHKHMDAGKLVTAICAAPAHVLGEATGIVKGRKATGDPGFNDKLAKSGAKVTDDDVTVDGNLITGRGPGAALRFGLRVASALVGNDEPDKLAELWRIKYR
jgi:4-methyl-5(b-hydroxyethyl)-thiazole monophosphate biosynthesis